MSWTHSICDDCWDKREPERLSRRTGQGRVEICCYCKALHASGIFVRQDPKELTCEHA